MTGLTGQAWNTIRGVKVVKPVKGPPILTLARCTKLGEGG